jgi:hypothetical protein
MPPKTPSVQPPASKYLATHNVRRISLEQFPIVFESCLRRLRRLYTYTSEDFNARRTGELLCQALQACLHSQQSVRRNARAVRATHGHTSATSTRPTSSAASASCSRNAHTRNSESLTTRKRFKQEDAPSSPMRPTAFFSSRGRPASKTSCERRRLRARKWASLSSALLGSAVMAAHKGLSAYADPFFSPFSYVSSDLCPFRLHYTLMLIQ